MVNIILPDNSKMNPPTQKEIRKKQQEERKHLAKHGNSPIDKRLEDNRKQQWIPENTKYYLNTVIRDITPFLTTDQLLQLVKVMCDTFNCIECTKTKRKDNPKKYNAFLINEFIKTRTAEACSKKTLEYYETTIKRFDKHVQKSFDSIETEDIEAYFMTEMTREKHPWAPTTQDNVRRILNTFYEWAVGRKYVLFNPVKAIKPTKKKKYRVKKPFTNKDIILLRDACESIRDRSIVEFLLSSGVRVGELVNINREDIDWNEREVAVIGKGNKQRIAYFNEQAGYYMQKYIDSRTDDNPAMWVSEFEPHNRLGITGTEQVIHNLGERAGIKSRCHPHRFRHTFATRALDKGIPIEQVQKLLGHEQLDTTLIYAKIALEDVKYNHKKLMN